MEAVNDIFRNIELTMPDTAAGSRLRGCGHFADWGQLGGGETKTAVLEVVRGPTPNVHFSYFPGHLKRRTMIMAVIIGLCGVLKTNRIGGVGTRVNVPFGIWD